MVKNFAFSLETREGGGSRNERCRGRGNPFYVRGIWWLWGKFLRVTLQPFFLWRFKLVNLLIANGALAAPVVN